MPQSKESNLPVWEDAYNHYTYLTIEDFDEYTMGFVYLIDFSDGKKYLGKKVLYTHVWVPRSNPLKRHSKSVKVKSRNTGNGYRKVYDLVIRESSWKTYKGSSSETAKRTPIKRTILALAYSERELTYLETKFLFQYNVLEDEAFLNGNILGKFFKGNLR